MDRRYNIVLLLKETEKFCFWDVRLITHHIRKHWSGERAPRIVCLWDRATSVFELGSFELWPMPHPDYRDWWCKMNLYHPDLDSLRPFLYLDLDTAVLGDLKPLMDKILDEFPDDFIMLEDFNIKDQPSGGVMWFPAGDDENNNTILQAFAERGEEVRRTDVFLEKYRGKPDRYFQDFSNEIEAFRVLMKRVKKTSARGRWLTEVNQKTTLVCFWGKTKIPAGCRKADWVKEYVKDFENS